MKRRKGKKEREMLSYEDKPIEEYERDENKKNKKKPLNGRAKVIVVIIAALVVIVGGVSIWNYIGPNALQGSLASSKANGKGFPVKIQGKTISEGDANIVNNNLAYTSDTEFQIINSGGGIVVDQRVKYASPAMTVNGDYAIIYDKSGNQFQISNGSGIIYEGSVEDTIYTATINKNGDYAILSKKSGYTSKLTVFNKNNEQHYAYYFSECYTTGVSINSSLTQAVVCGLDASKGSIVSKIYVLDFTKEEPVAKLDFKDVTVYDARFMSNGNIAVIGDTTAMVITSDYKNKYDFTYNGYNLRSRKITDNGIFLSLSPFEDGKSCEIWSISERGITTITKTDMPVDSMDICGDNAAVLSNNKITLFDTSTQTTLKDYDAGLDAQSIVYANNNTVYVIGITEIRKVEL